MADIRCLPGASYIPEMSFLTRYFSQFANILDLDVSGMEGSPVFNENAQFVGFLTRPLRQKISGTEIQVRRVVFVYLTCLVKLFDW